MKWRTYCKKWSAIQEKQELNGLSCISILYSHNKRKIMQTMFHLHISILLKYRLDSIETSMKRMGKVYTKISLVKIQLKKKINSTIKIFLKIIKLTINLFPLNHLRIWIINLRIIMSLIDSKCLLSHSRMKKLQK